MNTTHLVRPGGLTATVALLCAAGGCVDSNSRSMLGTGLDDGVVLETFTAPQFPDPREGPTRTDDHPSLIGLSRDHWSSQRFLVPVDGTRHRPDYASNLHYTDSLARQRREYPTLLSSLNHDGSEIDDNAQDDRWAEALVSPWHALWEMVLIPVKLFAEPQSLEEASPEESYQRRPGNRAKLAGAPLHPLEEPLRRPELRERAP